MSESSGHHCPDGYFCNRWPCADAPDDPHRGWFRRLWDLVIPPGANNAQ